MALPACGAAPTGASRPLLEPRPLLLLGHVPPYRLLVQPDGAHVVPQNVLSFPTALAHSGWRSLSTIALFPFT